METSINKVEMIEEFRVCPSCGYEDGFHSMFRIYHGTVGWLLICPACHKIYDIGLTAGDCTTQQS